jgi:murein DD-endopeptidase MepM/ murein hydrolase activator NlpD
LLVTLLGCDEPAPRVSAEAELQVASSTTAQTATVAAEAGPKRPTDPFYANLHHLKVSIRSSLEASVVAGTNATLGPALTQVAKRVLVWWIDPNRDLYPGDELELVYSTPNGVEPAVHAIWFRSEKLGRSFEAVHFVPSGALHPRWFDPEGREIELRLKDGPIREYEQITSILKDGRGHKGVDFKAPTGTPVYAPFDGRVERKNWSLRGNGLALDLAELRSGRRALLLHLSAIVKGLRPGSRVKKGQLIAYSGNTGRSTAPHLHYQLQRSLHGKVIDPFDFHRTWRARLPDSEMPALRERLIKYSKLRESVT